MSGASGARHVLVAQSGSLQIFDRALGVVREKGIDAEFGIVPPFVFAVGDARKNQYAGALQARCFGTVDFAETEYDARRLVPAQRRKIIARLPWHAEQAGDRKSTRLNSSH